MASFERGSISPSARPQAYSLSSSLHDDKVSSSHSERRERAWRTLRRKAYLEQSFQEEEERNEPVDERQDQRLVDGGKYVRHVWTRRDSCEERWVVHRVERIEWPNWESDTISLDSTSKRSKDRELYLLCSLVLPHESISSLQSQSDDTVQIIATWQNRHLSKLFVTPLAKVVLFALREIIPRDRDAVSFAIEFEEYRSTTENEEVGIFSDDSIY